MRSLTTGATGMMAQQLNIDVIANNIANVNTTGFKGGTAVFEEYMMPGARHDDFRGGDRQPWEFALVAGDSVLMQLASRMAPGASKVRGGSLGDGSSPESASVTSAIGTRIQ